MQQYNKLSFNQKATIVILIVIPLLAVFIPIIYENLNEPKIEIYQFQPSCDDFVSQGNYLYHVHNTGRTAATNLEIKMLAQSSVVINIDTAPSTASMSITPFGGDESGVNTVIISVPTFPPSSDFAIVIMDDPNSSNVDTIVSENFFPNNVPIRISEVWYDQGSFKYEDKFIACPSMVDITSTPPIINVTSTP